MSPKRQRLIFVLFTVVFVSVAVLLVLNAFKSNIVFFFSPSDLAEKHPSPEATIRIGGLVKQGSVQQKENEVQFKVTDGKHSVTVFYIGLLPDLFREGQGVIAEGNMNGEHSFQAKRILAKHDENYMPREVADSLKKSGYWKGNASP